MGIRVPGPRQTCSRCGQISPSASKDPGSLDSKRSRSVGSHVLMPGGAELNFAGLPYSAGRLMRHGFRRAVVREHDPLYSACRVDEQAAGRLVVAAGLPESRRCLRIDLLVAMGGIPRGLLWSARRAASPAESDFRRGRFGRPVGKRIAATSPPEGTFVSQQSGFCEQAGDLRYSGAWQAGGRTFSPPRYSGNSGGNPPVPPMPLFRPRRPPDVAKRLMALPA